MLSNSQEFVCARYDILEIEKDKLKKENATQSKKTSDSERQFYQNREKSGNRGY